MGGSTFAPYGFTSSPTGYAEFLLGGVIGTAYGCSLPFLIPPKLVVCTGGALYCGNPWFDRTEFVPIPGTESVSKKLAQAAHKTHQKHPRYRRL